MNDLLRTVRRSCLAAALLLALGLLQGPAAVADTHLDPAEYQYRDAVSRVCNTLWPSSTASLFCSTFVIVAELNYSQNCNILATCSVLGQSVQVQGNFDQQEFDDLYLCGTQFQVVPCASDSEEDAN